MHTITTIGSDHVAVTDLWRQAIEIRTTQIGHSRAANQEIDLARLHACTVDEQLRILCVQL